MRALFIGVVALASIVGASAHADSINIAYYSIAHTPGTAGSPNGDFGVCCSTAQGATLPNISVGASLGPNGRPVQETGGINPVVSLNGSNEIQWWSGVPTLTTSTTLPFLDASMYAPNGTGANNSAFFQTAILSGTVLGSGSETVLKVQGDDDVLVYLDGKYVGGTPGVHGASEFLVSLGILANVPHDLRVFYADRAEVGAVFGIELQGGTISADPVPGPIVGAGLPGLVMALSGLFVLARRRRNACVA